MEENKVATVLAKILKNADLNRNYIDAWHECVAERILQSPDLRVTIREPRYYVDPDYDTQNSRLVVRDRDARPGGWTALAYFNSEKHAREYCEFLNSKEPK